MGFVLDIILIIIVAACVIYGYKKGFFKTVMSLMSGVCALLCAYTFTPAVSLFLKEKFIINKVAGSITSTFSSIAEAGVDEAQNVLYDMTRLVQSPQFESTLGQCNADESAVMDIIGSAEKGSIDVIEAVAYEVAEPISAAFAHALAFVIVFVVSFILIRLAVWVVGFIFKLPVLEGVDKGLGLVFGGICALLFVWTFSLIASTLSAALSGIAPGTFSTDIIESSLLVELFAKYNPIGLIFSNIL